MCVCIYTTVFTYTILYTVKGCICIHIYVYVFYTVIIMHTWIWEVYSLLHDFILFLYTVCVVSCYDLSVALCSSGRCC